MTQHESSGEQALQARKVEWDQPNPIFEDVSPLQDALIQINDFDVNNASGVGTELAGFPETSTAIELPNGNVVKLDVYAVDRAWIEANSEPGNSRRALWGASWSSHYTREGREVVSTLPLVLSGNWHGPEGLPPLFTATISSATGGSDEQFSATNWTFGEKKAEGLAFRGFLVPTDAYSDTTVVLIPGSAKFVAGLQITFHEPPQIDRRG